MPIHFSRILFYPFKKPLILQILLYLGVLPLYSTRLRQMTRSSLLQHTVQEMLTKDLHISFLK